MIEREYGRKPNLYVYTCLIQACVQSKQVKRSWDIFNQMLQSGVAPDAVTYGTVIHSCIYCNKFEQAMTLVRHAYMLPCQANLRQGQPFALDWAERPRTIPLQPEVLRTLLGALRRKDQKALVEELEGIMASNATCA